MEDVLDSGRSQSHNQSNDDSWTGLFFLAGLVVAVGGGLVWWLGGAPYTSYGGWAFWIGLVVVVISLIVAWRRGEFD
ncbi:hypothetical protein A2851_00055 [Candidatus Kaiserbacteria bacterium RIFCSPHIGHO2_01_FULL_53_29]|uniref:Uncharacterized protein n=1 Tax=Candidatus Kaiserbacteria bacterium RIFCSPHIGHO2_01_FULL_53_29 TaxID=1798480 RepID=A0A1F6CW16_9BACT|nr:MAG: hypothetical protein A2851_00055 [Candidatus Kaiserbacteria bacterium RIFCSPHIGHO2_01_FULL_53_29]